jgi:RNA polymerase sigma-70 factor (ECF subfamily)
VVDAGNPDPSRARDALAGLCKVYWYPLYTFIRRRGYSSEDALDLVQEYFARLLEKVVIAAADPDRGRFRTFLMTDCSHFLSHHRARASARKRGGGRSVLSIDARDAEDRFLSEPADHLTPERIYERTWALTLLGRVLALLRAESVRSGREAVFDRLKSVLTGDAGSVPYAVLAADLGMTEDATKAAAYRLRRRYGALLREQIIATVGDPAEVEDEIRALFLALGAP